MSDDDELDGEKTQFWLPGKDFPGQPTAGDAAGKTPGNPIPAEPGHGSQEPVPGESGDSGGEQSIDFDLTAEETGDATGVDFDVTAANEAVPVTVDFDISGQNASEAGSASSAGAAPPPPLENRAASGGWILRVALIAIAGVVIYFVTR